MCLWSGPLTKKIRRSGDGIMSLRQHLDAWSILVIAITFVCFAAALFAAGLLHDVLVELGVFLVSVKVMLMSYRNSVVSESLHQMLKEVHSALQRLEGARSNRSGQADGET